VPTICQWCQRRANSAKDMLIVPFLHIQKFGTNISTLSVNCLPLALLMPIKLYAQIVTILLMLISPQLGYLILKVLI